MKKLILCDIDGTIIDGSRNMNEVSDKTKYAIKELAKDNYVFIASGRCKKLVDKRFRELHTNGLLLANGAYAELEGKQLFIESFDADAVKQIVDYTKAHNGFYVLESIDNLYVDDLHTERFDKFTTYWSLKKDLFSKCENFDDSYQIVMIGFDDLKTCRQAEKDLAKYCTIIQHRNYLSYDCDILGVSKGTGALKLMEYLRVNKEDTYCFGDGVNDLEMLEVVGHPVIMANAVEELRNRGFEETCDVLKDGFYEYLVANKLIKPM